MGEVVKRKIFFVLTGLFHVVEDTVWVDGLSWVSSLDEPEQKAHRRMVWSGTMFPKLHSFLP